jgi:hypothetical protein
MAEEFETTDVRTGGKGRSRFGGGMNWKILLAVVAIAGIGVLLMQTDSGRGYLDLASKYLGSWVGNAVAGFGGGNTPSGTPFTIDLRADKLSFIGQKYQVENATLMVSGTCNAPVLVGNVALHSEGGACTVELAGAKGTFEYADSGAIGFSGETDQVVSNGDRVTSIVEQGKTPTKVKVSLEVLADKFMLGDMTQDQVTLASVKGGMDRLSSDGTTVKSHEEMTSETLTIGHFTGFIKLDGSTINMHGIAYSVKGSDAHSSFVW